MLHATPVFRVEHVTCSSPPPPTVGRGSSPHICCHLLKTAWLCRALIYRVLWKKQTKGIILHCSRQACSFTGMLMSALVVHWPFRQLSHGKPLQRTCLQEQASGTLLSKLLQEKIINFTLFFFFSAKTCVFFPVKMNFSLLIVLPWHPRLLFPNTTLKRETTVHFARMAVHLQ